MRHFHIILSPHHNPLESEPPHTPPPPSSKKPSSETPSSSEAHWRASSLSVDQFSLWSAELDEIKDSENVLKAKLFPWSSPQSAALKAFFLSSPSFPLFCWQCWGCANGLLGVSASATGSSDWLRCPPPLNGPRHQGHVPLHREPLTSSCLQSSCLIKVLTVAPKWPPR